MAYINQKKYYTNDGATPTNENWGSYQYVSLEDVVNNFDKTLKQLVSFLNITWSEEFKNFHKNENNRRIINTPSYNQVNLPIYKKSISRWENYQKYFSDTRLLIEKWVKIFNY